jgi:hypothetical protein
MNEEMMKLRQMYSDIFSTETGKKLLHDLEMRCNYNASSFVAGDTNATSYEEGKRAVVLYIHNMMKEE